MKPSEALVMANTRVISGLETQCIAPLRGAEPGAAELGAHSSIVNGST